MSLTQIQSEWFYSRSIQARRRAAHRLAAVEHAEAFYQATGATFLALASAAAAYHVSWRTVAHWRTLLRGVSESNKQERLFVLIDRNAAKAGAA